MTFTKKTTLWLTIIALLIGGLVLWRVLLSARAQSTPNEVVQRFYTSWIKAARNAPPSPLEQDLHTKSTYVTPAFGQEVARLAERGEDGVLCGAPGDSTFVAQRAGITSDGTTAGVDVSFGTYRGHVVLVQDERGWWRIDEVDCSAPLNANEDTPRGASTSSQVESLNG